MPKQPIEHINIAELNHGQGSKLIKDISQNGKTAFIQKNGKPLAVIVSYETYQALLDQGIDLSDFSEKQGK